MNSRHRRTLDKLFAEPMPHTMRWSDVASLLGAVGMLTSGAGSRVHALVNGRPATFHMPHPSNEIRTKTIKDIRDFLADAGVRPD